jgi:hypothetical protein
MSDPPDKRIQQGRFSSRLGQGRVAGPRGGDGDAHEIMCFGSCPDCERASFQARSTPNQSFHQPPKSMALVNFHVRYVVKKVVLPGCERAGVASLFPMYVLECF